MENIIALAIVIILAFFITVTYNRLVALNQYRKQSFADIDVQLKQRLDLVPNLVEAVKGYASHEKGVFEEVTRARSRAMHSSGSGADRAAAESGMQSALMNLLMVSENYPDLKADQRFKQLQDELTDLENKIAAARRFFNNATAEYNMYMQQFPALYIARLLGFSEGDYLEFEAAERKAMAKAPEVKFA